VEIKIFESLMAGKRIKNRTQTERMISNPPPTGVPVLTLWNLSKIGVFLF
jgi:hypothetical protein